MDEQIKVHLKSPHPALSPEAERELMYLYLLIYP